MEVAVLYAMLDGPYSGLSDVDLWDVSRDARLYGGPYPVVAHPPCARWGRYWGGAPTTWPRLKRGDDDGCFEAALLAVRKYGGVLEHPADSYAWSAFGISKPPRTGGWIHCGLFDDAWTCYVEQGHYGHRARKGTWLYYRGPNPPELRWGRSAASVRLDKDFQTAEKRRRAVRTGACQRLSRRERMATPIPFRDLLLDMARPCQHIGDT